MSDLFAFCGTPLPEHKSDARQRFEEFHGGNPHVYEQFKRAAFQLMELGVRHVGARLVAEQLRCGFKLNNDYTPFYIRLFLTDHPEHRDSFELRNSLADR